MALYKQSPGELNYVATVNQVVDALSGQADAGTISLLAPLAAPGALNATATTGTALGIGTYRYKVTFLTGSVKGDGTLNIVGETAGGASTTITTTSGNQAVNLTSIPTGGTGCIGRRVYRTAVGGADGTQLSAFTIDDNTSTSWKDTTSDASLGTAVPTSGSTGTTIGSGNTDVVPVRVLVAPVDTRGWTATAWDAANPDQPTHIDITDGTTVVATLDLTWSIDAKLTQCVATIGTIVITYDVTWSGVRFVSLTKGVA